MTSTSRVIIVEASADHENGEVVSKRTVTAGTIWRVSAVEAEGRGESTEMRKRRVCTAESIMMVANVK